VVVVVVAGATVVVAGRPGTPPVDSPRLTSTERCRDLVPGPYTPSTSTPRTCCRRRTRAPVSPQAKPDVRTVTSETGKTVVDGATVTGAIVLVAVDGGALVVVASATGADELGSVVVVAGASEAMADVVVVAGASEAMADVVVGADPPSGSSSIPSHSAAGASDPGTFNTTGEPRVTNVPARGNCSTTVPETPSRPSTTSTMAGDPMVLSTPAANWTVFPTTDGTSNSSGESSNSGTATSSSEQAAIDAAINATAARAFSHLRRCPAPATRPMTRVSQTNDPPLRTCILRGPTG